MAWHAGHDLKPTLHFRLLQGNLVMMQHTLRSTIRSVSSRAGYATQSTSDALPVPIGHFAASLPCEAMVEFQKPAHRPACDLQARTD